MRTAALGRTWTVVTSSMHRRDAMAVALFSATAYLLLYLYAIGNLFISPAVGFDVLVVGDPLGRMVEPGPGRFTFEPIAIVDLWRVTILVSPLNGAIGFGLASLVGLNFALSFLALTKPSSCGFGATTGIFAAVPAILASSACCAPILLLVLGVSIGALGIAIVSWLLPVGIALLLASLVYLSMRIDPIAIAGQTG